MGKHYSSGITLMVVISTMALLLLASGKSTSPITFSISHFDDGPNNAFAQLAKYNLSQQDTLTPFPNNNQQGQGQTIPSQQELNASKLSQSQPKVNYSVFRQSETSPSQNLLTYQNDEHGVKIKYPSDWSAEETDNGTTPFVRILAPNSSDASAYYYPALSINIETLEYKNQSLPNYLNYTIDAYKTSSPDSKITSLNTNSLLSNHTAYLLTLTYRDDDDGLLYNTLEIGTVIGSKAYYVAFTADSSSYSAFLPTVERIIDSLAVKPLEQQKEEESIPKPTVEPDAFITISPEYYWWDVDPLNVYVVVNGQSNRHSLEYIDDAKSAVSKWSNVLKQYSGNPDAWNFNVYESHKQLEFGQNGAVTNNLDPPADIILELKEDPSGTECFEAGIDGITEYLEDPTAGPLYTYSYTSCKGDQYTNDYVYATVSHEFAHALGLGHAYNTSGDLLCGLDEGEGFLEDGNGESIRSCDTVNERVEPSELDINGLLFMYGMDGFGEPNNSDLYESHGDRLYYVYGKANVTGQEWSWIYVDKATTTKNIITR